MVRLSSDDENTAAGPSRAFSGVSPVREAPEMRQTANSTAAAIDPALIRPSVYYNDGPFDAPSSSDEEAESLLEGQAREPPSSPGAAELGLPSSARSARTVDGRSMVRSPTRNPASWSLRFLIFGLVGLVALACGIGLLASMVYTAQPVKSGLRKYTMDHVFNGTFIPASQSLHWVPEAGDGVFSVSDSGSVKLVDLKTESSKQLVTFRDIQDDKGTPLEVWGWWVSPDMKHILVQADYRKQWRHSGYGNYYIHNLETKQTWPITPPSSPAQTSYATWSPTGEAIAFVTHNDLYVLPSATPNTRPIRVTNSGNASLFHGVPDWVYEEEIFSGDSALWWSPDSKKVAFLAFDETKVPEYTFPIYNPSESSETVVPYTSEVVMKYPKPGYPNPIVSAHVFDLQRYLDNRPDIEDGAVPDFPSKEETLTLDWDPRHPEDNSIIMEVAWVANSSLIIKEVNRNADDGRVVYFDLEEATAKERAVGEVVRRLGKKGEEADDGWIDNHQTIYPLHLADSAGHTAYLDVVPTPEGYNHIALFSPATSSKPQFLTNGPWEITGTIKQVDVKNRLVYFTAAKPSSTERHIYSVEIPKDFFSQTFEPTDSPTALTDTTKLGYYDASFSPQAGFYVLSYLGPNVPWQKVISTQNATFTYELTENERLKNVTMEYEAPIVSYSTITVDGHELNVKEMRPPNFDDSGRTMYPVLFNVYGGPFSQTVDVRFSRGNWHNYVACGLKYIVVVVDGRGTGYKGRKLRNSVKGNLGFFETIDQIEAAKIWAKKNYVDPRRIGIWGWSYGGFMSAKVLEANAGVHSLAMSVAPVTSWRLYDSIYTERYMNLPELNPGGYINASISNVEGFRNADFLFAHGSGDDNVHYSNSAHLLDMLTQSQVRGFRFRMFTDSDHSIYRRGGNREIYEFLTSFIVEKWGKGPKKRGS